MLKCPKCDKEFLDDKTTTWQEERREKIYDNLNPGHTRGTILIYEEKAKCPHCGHIWVYNEWMKEGTLEKIIQTITHTPGNLWKAAWKKLWNKIFG